MEAFDCLLDAYARLGEALPIFSAVDNLFTSHVPSHVRQTLANIYEDILKFHQRATVFFKQRGKLPTIYLNSMLTNDQLGP